MRQILALVIAASIALGALTDAAVVEPRLPAAAAAELLADGIQGASGSTVGPGGALFVTEGATGSVLRVDPKTGDVTTFATGLPPSIVGIGGAIDVAFIGTNAYVLVTLVGPDVGGNDVVGIYRVDSPTSAYPIADIGEFAVNNPPLTPFDVPTGLQFALDVFRAGFLVTDGHHNRVLQVTLDGEVSEFRAFGNIVPTGLAILGNTIYMAEAGAVPHLPQDGRVVAFGAKPSGVLEVASGAPLLVDVEFGRGRSLYALSQGDFPPGGAPAEPALPDTGALLLVDGHGGFTVVADGLNRPTSVEIIGDTAYVITLEGEIWTIPNVAR
jgi:hypothetical protein